MYNIDLPSEVQSGTLLKNNTTTPIYLWKWYDLMPIPYRW